MPVCTGRIHLRQTREGVCVSIQAAKVDKSTEVVRERHQAILQMPAGAPKFDSMGLRPH